MNEPCSYLDLYFQMSPIKTKLNYPFFNKAKLNQQLSTELFPFA